MVDGSEGDATRDGRPTAAERMRQLVLIAELLETGGLTAEDARMQATGLRTAIAGLGNHIGDYDDAMRSAAQVTATLSIRLDEGSPEQRCAEELARGLAAAVDPPLKLDFDALAEADLESDLDDEDDDDHHAEDPGAEIPVSGRAWIEISHMNGSRTFALEVRSKSDPGGNPVLDAVLGTLVRTTTWGSEDGEFSTTQSWLPTVTIADLQTHPKDDPGVR